LSFARPVVRDVALAAALRRALDKHKGEWRAPRVTDDLVALVRQLREGACRAADTRVDPARQEIRAVRALITGAPLRGVRLADLAAAAGLSQFHFSRVFKSEVGLPPYAFFEQVRIAFAHDLIHQGHDLASVAFQLGYADQSHLTRQFHKGSFTTPGRYAQMTRMNLGGTKGRTGSTL
jgi:AraC-like DNA-binding protein